jgi:hypothetical protein
VAWRHPAASQIPRPVFERSDDLGVVAVVRRRQFRPVEEAAELAGPAHFMFCDRDFLDRDVV